MIVYGLILFGVLLNATAQLLLKAGMNHVGHFAFSWDNVVPIGMRIAFNPYVFGGLCCYIISVSVWLLALSRIEVSIAYPMLSMGYIVNAIAAYYLFGEDLSILRIAGIGVIIIGVIMVAK